MKHRATVPFVILGLITHAVRAMAVVLRAVSRVAAYTLLGMAVICLLGIIAAGYWGGAPEDIVRATFECGALVVLALVMVCLVVCVTLGLIEDFKVGGGTSALAEAGHVAWESATTGTRILIKRVHRDSTTRRRMKLQLLRDLPHGSAVVVDLCGGRIHVSANGTGVAKWDGIHWRPARWTIASPDDHERCPVIGSLSAITRWTGRLPVPERSGDGMVRGLMAFRHKWDKWDDERRGADWVSRKDDAQTKPVPDEFNPIVKGFLKALAL